MAGEIVMKAGDTAPIVRSTLLDAAGAQVDLAGATVKFIMALKTDKTVVVDAAASNDQVTDGSDGSKGKVSYAWVTGDTAVAGSFLAELEVTFSSGAVQSFPTTGYIPVTITDDLGGTV